jgi:hypothetical protein
MCPLTAAIKRNKYFILVENTSREILLHSGYMSSIIITEDFLSPQKRYHEAILELVNMTAT